VEGDRAFCLARDCDVIITSWTDAPIPWPRCRALDSPGGGSGILVEEELARAIRHGSAEALKFWWRASRCTVHWWRKVLDVSRVGTEGSRRLIRAAAQVEADVMKCRGYTDEECEARSRRAIELNLAQFLRKTPRPNAWLPEEIALLPEKLIKQSATWGSADSSGYRCR
jgi:hypothetical protein